MSKKVAVGMLLQDIVTGIIFIFAFGIGLVINAVMVMLRKINGKFMTLLPKHM